MTKTVYLLYHEPSPASARKDARLIGVYSSEVHAEVAARHAVTLPGFRNHPNGFIIDKHSVDDTNFAVGFADAPPENEEETSITTTQATLRIFSDEASLDFVSQAFGLSPSRAYLIGEPQNRRNPQGSKRKESAWLFESPLPDNSELADHIAHLLVLLEDRASAIRSIRSQITSMDIFCMYSSDNGQGSAVLDAKLILRLAKQDIDVVFDLYPPN